MGNLKKIETQTPIVDLLVSVLEKYEGDIYKAALTKYIECLGLRTFYKEIYTMITFVYINKHMIDIGVTNEERLLRVEDILFKSFYKAREDFSKIFSEMDMTKNKKDIDNLKIILKDFEFNIAEVTAEQKLREGGFYPSID